MAECQVRETCIALKRAFEDGVLERGVGEEVHSRGGGVEARRMMSRKRSAGRREMGEYCVALADQLAVRRGRCSTYRSFVYNLSHDSELLLELL